MPCERYNYNWIEEGFDKKRNKILHFKSNRFNKLEFQKIISRRLKLYLIPQVVEELKKIISKKSKSLKGDKLILDNLNQFEVLDTRYYFDVDESILMASKQFNAAVATADIKLKNKLRELGIPIITLRGKKLYCQPEDPEFWFI